MSGAKWALPRRIDRLVRALGWRSVPAARAEPGDSLRGSAKLRPVQSEELRIDAELRSPTGLETGHPRRSKHRSDRGSVHGWQALDRNLREFDGQRHPGDRRCHATKSGVGAARCVACGTDSRTPAPKVSRTVQFYSEEPRSRGIKTKGYGEGQISDFTATEGIFATEVRGCRATILNPLRQFTVTCKCPPALFPEAKPVFEKVISTMNCGVVAQQ